MARKLAQRGLKQVAQRHLNTVDALMDIPRWNAEPRQDMLQAELWVKSKVKRMSRPTSSGCTALAICSGVGPSVVAITANPETKSSRARQGRG